MIWRTKLQLIKRSSRLIGNPSSGFCLLSPVLCLLLYLPILPTLPRIHESIMQNKPNSLTVKNNATPFATNSYANIPLPCAGKNKPNQTQSPNAIRDTQHAIRKSNPNKPNFKIGKMKISTAIIKAYANQQRTMNNEHYPKQTQTNPIPPPRESALCNSLPNRNRQPAEVTKHRTTKNPGEFPNRQTINSRNY